MYWHLLTFMEKAYLDAHNWYTENQQNLGAYRGEWIAFTSDGVIAHDFDVEFKQTKREIVFRFAEPVKLSQDRS
jgi:hypothetical protein